MTATENELLQHGSGVSFASDQISTPGVTRVTESPVLSVTPDVANHITPHNPDHDARVAATAIGSTLGTTPTVGSAEAHGDGSTVTVGNTTKKHGIQMIPTHPGGEILEATKEFIVGTFQVGISQIWPNHEGGVYSKYRQDRIEEQKRAHTVSQN